MSARFAEVKRQPLGLGLGQIGELRLDRFGHPPMQHPAPRPQKRSVGRVAHQCVAKGVAGVATHLDQRGALELVQTLADLGLGQVGTGSQQVERGNSAPISAPICAPPGLPASEPVERAIRYPEG